MAFRLKVFSERDPLSIRTFVPVPGAPLVVGREDGVDCLLADDAKVSRRHGAIEVGPDGGVAIRDLGSTNGLRVNGIAYGGKHGWRDADGSVPAAPLRPGDHIRIGGFTLILEEDAGVNAGIREKPSAPGDRRDAADAPEQPCAQCGHPVRADSAALAGGRVLCMSCRLTGDEAAPSAPASRPPPDIPGYRVTRLVGEGGLGRVYHAYRGADGADVAIKVLSVGPATHTSDLLLFKRETDIMGAVRHENIVAFHEAGRAGGAPYVVMEYMAGGTLSRFMRKRGALPVAMALPIIRQMLSGLAAAHARGVIHRDVKPLNVLLDGAEKNPVVKLTDFGLAKSFLAAGLSGFTKTGTSFGSLNYLPPEQVHNYKRVTPAADVFAVGAICYELLTGRSPYTVKHGDYMTAVINHDITPLAVHAPKLPTALTRPIDRALAREPGERFENAGEMLAAIDSAVDS